MARGVLKTVSEHVKRAGPILLLAFLLSGCAAHGGPAGSRLPGAGAADRSSDGWQKTSSKAVSGAPASKKADAKAEAAPAPKPAATAAATPAPEVKVALASPEPVPAKPDSRAKAVANGRAILAGTAPRPKRQDCSGFVTCVYERAGAPLEIAPEHTRGTTSMAEMLYRAAKAEGRSHREKPKPGDLAFFKNTYGRLDGRITHVAIVESVAEDGTVTLLHHIGGRYRRSPMNLSVPHEPLKNGYFRKKQSANEPVLAGELFVAYARPG